MMKKVREKDRQITSFTFPELESVGVRMEALILRLPMNLMNALRV